MSLLDRFLMAWNCILGAGTIIFAIAAIVAFVMFIISHHMD